MARQMKNQNGRGHSIKHFAKKVDERRTEWLANVGWSRVESETGA